MAAMPKANIYWSEVFSFHSTYVRQTPKGGNSYFLVVDEGGKEFVPYWEGRESHQAQGWLNRMASMTKRRAAKANA